VAGSGKNGRTEEADGVPEKGEGPGTTTRNQRGAGLGWGPLHDTRGPAGLQGGFIPLGRANLVRGSPPPPVGIPR